jgi:hypothetical protein
LKALKACLPTSSKTVPFPVLKNSFKILNKYILAASIVPHIIHALLCLRCLPRIKVEALQQKQA